VTKIAIMQPTFMPWVGYFDLINSVDTFVFLDDVQLSKRSWQVKNKIKASHGESFITLPIKKDKSRDDQYINNSFISVDEKWRNKTLKSIELNYKKTPYFKDTFPLFKEWTSSNSSLSEIHIKMIKRIANMLSFDDVDFITSSSLGIEGSKETKLLDICKQISAQTYLSPQGSSAYIQPTNLADRFKENNIDLLYHDYEPVKYKQLHGEFIPYLGIFDLLFNEGFEKSVEIIINGHKNNIYYKDFHKT
jgi:hypothetical protein